MKSIDPFVMYGESAETDISSRLDSMHHKFMLRRKNVFDQLIQKYEKPTQSPILDLRNNKVIDVPAKITSVRPVKMLKEEPVFMKMPQNEKEELSAIIRIVQSYKTSFENDTDSFCGNSTNDKTSSIKSIKIRRKRIIERLPSTALKRKITDTPLCSRSKTSFKQQQMMHPVRQHRKRSKHRDEIQLVSPKQKLPNGILLKQTPLKKEVSMRSVTVTKSGRPVRQCTLNSAKVVEDETQLVSPKRKLLKGILLKQITLREEVSMSCETGTKSGRPVRQCTLNSAKVVEESVSDEDDISPELVDLKKLGRKSSKKNSDGDYFESLPYHVRLKRLRKGVSISGLTITKQGGKTSECINHYSVRKRKSSKESSEGVMNTKPPAMPTLNTNPEDRRDTKTVAERSSINAPVQKCTCHKTVSDRKQPSRKCKENSPFCQRISCSYCKKKIGEKYYGQIQLNECSVVCEKISDSMLINILSQKKKIVASNLISCKTVQKTDKTNCTTNQSLQHHVSNNDNHNVNVSSVNMNIVLETSQFSSKIHSSVAEKSTEVTVSHNYKKNSFVSVSSRSVEQPSKNISHFSFLNRTNTFVTLPSAQNISCLIPANLSMSVSKSPYIHKLFNVKKWLR